MRTLLILLLLFPFFSLANSDLDSRCPDLTQVEKAHFMAFGLKDFIEFGQCMGVKLLKAGKDQSLVEACGEVIEDNDYPLSFWRTSKAEAIKIGQCLGVINYIYEHYNNEPISVRLYGSNQSRGRKYHCQKGRYAVTVLIQDSSVPVSREDVLSILCQW